MGLVHLPAYGEEMNRCRYMVAWQARELAGYGVCVLVLDPWGTGDSEGDFEDATWDVWRADAQVAVRWLEARGCSSIGLWGMRLGALLAADVASVTERVTRLLLWQPVLRGAAMVKELMRMRAAAAMNLGTTTVKAAPANDGDALVGGYSIGAAMLETMATVSMDGFSVRPGMRVDWRDVTASPQVRTAPARDQQVSRWLDSGADVRLEQVAGAPFWHLPERTVVPDLVTSTNAAFAA